MELRRQAIAATPNAPFTVTACCAMGGRTECLHLVTKEYFFANKRPLYTKKIPFCAKFANPHCHVLRTRHRTRADLERLTCPNKRGYAAANGYDFINAFEHDDLQDEYVRNYNMNPNKTPQMFKLRLLPLLMTTYVTSG